MLQGSFAGFLFRGMIGVPVRVPLREGPFMALCTAVGGLGFRV